MNYTQTIAEKIHGVSITRTDEQIFYALISIDIHTQPKSLKTEALSMLYADVLLAGCRTYTKETFLDALNLLGATITVAIHNDVLTFGLQCLDIHKTKLLALFTLLITKPSFRENEIKNAVLILCNELEEEKEDAKNKVVHSFINVLYKKGDRRFSFGNDELKNQLKLLRKKDLELFHTTALGGKWIYTIAANSTDASKTVSIFTKLRTQFTDTVTEVEKPLPVSLTKTIVETISIPSKQNIELAIGAPLPLSLNDDEYHAFVFGLNVLGKWGGFAGRLMSTVREKEGLTYGIYAQTETATRTTTGHWRIMTFFAPDKVMQGIHSTLRQIKLIQEKGISKSEFVRFMNIIETQEILLQDSILKNIQHIHAFLLRGFSLSEIALYKQKRKSVTQKQVNTALKKYLDVHTLVISAAGPTETQQKKLYTLKKLAKTSK